MYGERSPVATHENAITASARNFLARLPARCSRERHRHVDFHQRQAETLIHKLVGVYGAAVYCAIDGG